MSLGRIAEDFFGEPLSEAGWQANKSDEVTTEARSGAYRFIIAEVGGEVIGHASWNHKDIPRAL